MATSPQLRPDADDDERGPVAPHRPDARSAAGVGLALTGSLTGLFGTRRRWRRTASPAGPATARSSPTPPACSRCPAGFSYTIVAQSGVTTLETRRADAVGPRRHRRASSRRGGDGTVLVNNHEIGGSEPYRVPHLPGFVYDPAAGGGTTNIEVDQRRQPDPRVRQPGRHAQQLRRRQVARGTPG